MARDILLFPSLNDELRSRIRFQKSAFSFYYSDDNEDEYELKDEPVEAMSSVMAIRDENGVWTQDEYNFGFRRRYLLRTFDVLFGESGIACKDARLGLAVVWTSSDSKQRGVIPAGTFCLKDNVFEAFAEFTFGKAQLRGEVNFTTILYIADPGSPKENEHHLADRNGYVLGELDNYTVRLDGSGSTFPVFEVNEPGQPLWYVRCDWIDPTTDMFSESVSVNINTAHKNYKYIDRTQNTFDSQLLTEIMASAISIIIEKVRLQSAYWDQVLTNDSLETGSVGQAIYYFTDALEWDLSTPESVSLCARKFFDQRM